MTTQRNHPKRICLCVVGYILRQNKNCQKYLFSVITLLMTVLVLLHSETVVEHMRQTENTDTDNWDFLHRKNNTY